MSYLTNPEQITESVARRLPPPTSPYIGADLRVSLERVLASAVAVAIILVMGGCSTGNTKAAAAPPQIGPLTQSASECTLEAGEDPVSAGQVAITVVNKTDAEVSFDMWRIAEGHTYEEFAAHIDEERRLAEAGEQVLGPPSYAEDLIQIKVQPGESEIFETLSPGTYAIVCFEEYDQVGGRPSALVGPVEVE